MTTNLTDSCIRKAEFLNIDVVKVNWETTAKPMDKLGKCDKIRHNTSLLCLALLHTKMKIHYK
ncbi:hypothetical protein T03_11635 [Trichinella britovi]|uniref:Uncharacterized protein n=1 Tax=Trichinella britovi TaxID=45882 RepID=A0A0V1CZH5_TRIBR|nr:hypothetical protein T03_11635 [Trichinella britovi]